MWKSTEFQIGGKCRQRKWWKADGVMQVLYRYSKTENDRDSFTEPKILLLGLEL